MSVSAIDIIGLPPAVGLTNTALIEVQVGPSGPDSSRKATIAEVLALAPAIAIDGAATVTITERRGVFEHIQIVAAVGVTPASRIAVSLNQDATDVAENDPELLDVASMWATAGTGEIAIGMTFGSLTSGPIILNWSAS